MYDSAEIYTPGRLLLHLFRKWRFFTSLRVWPFRVGAERFATIHCSFAPKLHLVWLRVHPWLAVWSPQQSVGFRIARDLTTGNIPGQRTAKLH